MRLLVKNIIILNLCFVSLYNVKAQIPNILDLNTAANGTNAIPVNSLDTNWHVAFGDAVGPTSSFNPSVVLGRCTSTGWYSSPFSNANWIGPECYPNGYPRLDLYFRRNINLPATNNCGQPISNNLCLAMDFYADNCVYKITVNGVPNFITPLPDISVNEYNGYQIATSVNLCSGWKTGLNSILVHVISGSGPAGFLAQGNLRINNKYYYSYTVNKNICSGQTFQGHSSSGIYVDSLKGINGCDSIRTVKLVVRPTYRITETKTICAGTTYNFHGQIISREGEYMAKFSSSLGCDSIVKLIIKEAHNNFLGKDTSVCNDIIYTLRSPSENTIWFDNSISKTKKVNATGSYWAQILDANGCKIVDTVFVRFNNKLYIPNIFSPNDDGTNDCFMPEYSELIFSSYKFSIFDRWGDLVFTTDNPNDCWNGDFKGKPCDLGVYTYLLEIESEFCKKTILKGDVTIIK